MWKSKSFKLVGWVERSETQQVIELKGKIRVSRDEMRVIGGVLTPKKVDWIGNPFLRIQNQYYAAST
ncbi:hypothetical protein CWB79_08665 [Pseudoalteromonas sp. S1649]|nr:hypothetical protein CWB80_10175 [Pseudoalteromonas sp. S1650]TMP67349.1 hypothetical protein CWB79_08665 [Pseudoalteromonas sp. S1649]